MQEETTGKPRRLSFAQAMKRAHDKHKARLAAMTSEELEAYEREAEEVHRRLMSHEKHKKIDLYEGKTTIFL